MKETIAILCFCISAFTILEFSGWRFKVNIIQKIQQKEVFDFIREPYDMVEDYDQILAEENGTIPFQHDKNENDDNDNDKYANFESMEQTTFKTKEGIVVYHQDKGAQITSAGVNLAPFHAAGNVFDEPADYDDPEVKLEATKNQLRVVYGLLNEARLEVDNGMHFAFLTGMLVAMCIVIIAAMVAELFYYLVVTVNVINDTTSELSNSYKEGFQDFEDDVNDGINPIHFV